MMDFWNYFKYNRQSFSTKIFYLFTISILVIYFSFATFFIYYHGRIMRNNFINEGRLLARNLAYSLRLGVFTENTDLMRGPLEGFMQYNDAIGARIYADDGRELRSVVRHGGGIGERGTETLTEDSTRAIDYLKKGGSDFYFRRGNYFEFWAPVSSGERYAEESFFSEDNMSQEKTRLIGFVQIELTAGARDKGLKDVMFKGIIIPVILLFPGWMIAYFIVRGITKPLKKLTTGVKTLEATGVFERVPVETDDEIGRLASAFNDMTDSLKQREEEKKQLEEQLRHSQKMEAIGTFAGGIAHDFNNILTVIKSYAQMLQKKDLKGEEERRFLDQILSSTHKATALTRGLLAFSRKQTIDPRPVNLNPLIAEMEDMLRRIIDESIELVVDTAQEDLIVVADKVQVEHVLINLVTNAKDAMPEGGRLVISTRAIELIGQHSGVEDGRIAGRYAVLTITDTGMGMDRQTRERIFDPFFTTKDVGKGTGLGLSLVYGIINQHKGYIDVRSEPGRGTAFDILLPLSEASPREEAAEGVHEVKGGTETILLAEDDSDVRRLISDVLTRAGYTVIAAGDGDEAVNKFIDNKERIEFLLLDVMMPKKKGKAVYDEIRSMVPGIKAIFISGYAAEEPEGREGISHEPLLPEEGTELLYKPLVPDEILGRVREMLDRA